MAGKAVSRTWTGLYFIHIPKCAGTTFRTWLEDHFPADDVISIWNMTDALRVPPSKLKTNACISSHVGWSFMPHLAATHRVVTVLRDPIERTISAYRFILQSPTHRLHQLAKTMDILEFFCHPAARFSLGDEIARHLSFTSVEQTATVADIIENLLDGSIDIHIESLHKFNLGALNRAYANIQKVDFIGVTERLLDLAMDLCDFYTWYPPKELPRFNATRKEFVANISLDVLEEIKGINAADIQLYAYAQEKIEQRPQQTNRRISILTKFHKNFGLENAMENFQVDLAGC